MPTSPQRRAAPRSYRDLEVWRRSIGLARNTILASTKLPGYELYAMAGQMRRSAVSVPANIAEGWGRGSQREFLRFLSIARGSLLELSTHLEIAREVGYLTGHLADPLIDEADQLSRMLLALARSLRGQKD